MVDLGEGPEEIDVAANGLSYHCSYVSFQQPSISNF